MFLSTADSGEYPPILLLFNKVCSHYILKKTKNSETLSSLPIAIIYVYLSTHSFIHPSPTWLSIKINHLLI